MAMKRKELAFLKSIHEQEDKLPWLQAMQKYKGLDFQNGFQCLNQTPFSILHCSHEISNFGLLWRGVTGELQHVFFDRTHHSTSLHSLISKLFTKKKKKKKVHINKILMAQRKNLSVMRMQNMGKFNNTGMPTLVIFYLCMPDKSDF